MKRVNPLLETHSRSSSIDSTPELEWDDNESASGVLQARIWPARGKQRVEMLPRRAISSP